MQLFSPLFMLQTLERLKRPRRWLVFGRCLPADVHDLQHYFTIPPRPPRRIIMDIVSAPYSPDFPFGRDYCSCHLDGHVSI